MIDNWYLAVVKNGKTILDAVALTEWGFNSALNDYKLILDKGADELVVKHYAGDRLVQTDNYKRSSS